MPQQVQQLIDDAILRAEKIHDDGAENDPAQKMREINDGLNGALDFRQLQFVEHQRYRDGNHKAQHDLRHGNRDGVAKHVHGVGHGEDILEVLQSNPFLIAEQALGRDKALEGDDQTAQRNIMENENDDDAGDQHQMQRYFVPADFSPLFGTVHHCFLGHFSSSALQKGCAGCRGNRRSESSYLSCSWQPETERTTR